MKNLYDWMHRLTGQEPAEIRQLLRDCDRDNWPELCPCEACGIERDEREGLANMANNICEYDFLRWDFYPTK